MPRNRAATRLLGLDAPHYASSSPHKHSRIVPAGHAVAPRPSPSASEIGRSLQLPASTAKGVPPPHLAAASASSSKHDPDQPTESSMQSGSGSSASGAAPGSAAASSSASSSSSSSSSSPVVQPEALGGEQSYLDYRPHEPYPGQQGHDGMPETPAGASHAGAGASHAGDGSVPGADSSTGRFFAEGQGRASESGRSSSTGGKQQQQQQQQQQ